MAIIFSGCQLQYYSEQDTIDDETFWMKIFERIGAEFKPNEIIPMKTMIKFIETEGRKIAEDAFENFEASDDFLIHRGHWKSEAYWRS